MCDLFFRMNYIVELITKMDDNAIAIAIVVLIALIIFYPQLITSSVSKVKSLLSGGDSQAPGSDESAESAESFEAVPNSTMSARIVTDPEIQLAEAEDYQELMIKQGLEPSVGEHHKKYTKNVQKRTSTSSQHTVLDGYRAPVQFHGLPWSINYKHSAPRFNARQVPSEVQGTLPDDKRMSVY